MSIKFKRVLKDDDRFGLKAGDIIVVDLNYDWDPEKCICIGKLVIHNDHSMYNESLEAVTKGDLQDARKPLRSK